MCKSTLVLTWFGKCPQTKTSFTFLPPSVFPFSFDFWFLIISYFFADFSSVQSLGCVRLFVTPCIAARQATLSITNSRSLLIMSIELVMPSNHLIFCHPLLLLPSIFPSIRVFSSQSVIPIRWLKYWSFSFSISSSNDYSFFLLIM